MNGSKRFNVLKFIADNGGLSMVDAIAKAYNLGKQDGLEQKPIPDVLGKIRAEIKGWQVDIHDNENDADDHDFVFERIFEIIDEYRERDE